MNVNFPVCLLENLLRFKFQKQSNRFNPETGMESGKRNSFRRTGGVLTERGGLKQGSGKVAGRRNPTPTGIRQGPEPEGRVSLRLRGGFFLRGNIDFFRSNHYLFLKNGQKDSLPSWLENQRHIVCLKARSRASFDSYGTCMKKIIFLLLLSVLLYGLNPKMPDFKRFVLSHLQEQQNVHKGDFKAFLYSFFGPVVIEQMTTRKDFFLFSVYEISPPNGRGRLFLGILHVFIPLGTVSKAM